VEREDEIDVAEVVADLEGAAAHLGRGGEAGGGIGARTTPVPAPAPVGDTPAAAGRLVQVALRAEAPLKGGRALLVIKKGEGGRRNELAAYARDPAIDDVAIQVSRLSRELQAEIIQARMTPVWQVFDRFPRLVRDLARELGKQVAFRVEGKEIELDRAILDELGDPLLHLLRNAVDHGVESQAERRRRGKKPEAEIVLAAVRERASVAISVSDDGRGIDRKSIL